MPRLSSKVAGQYVMPSLFRSEMDFLTGRGWTSVPLAEVVERLTSGGSPLQNGFSVTFDDGYLSVYEHACPALIERSIPATIYVVADMIGGVNSWDKKIGDREERLMSKDQIRELSERGFEIGSHTLTHPHLTELDDDSLRREITDSKHKLEDILGKEVVSFSYPYGSCDNRVLQATVEAGYKYALSTRLGKITSGVGIFEIPRVNVRWNAVGPVLMRKIERARKG